MDFLIYKNDLIAVFLVVVLLFSYQVYLRRVSRRDSLAVLSNAATLARNAWVETVMANHADAILATNSSSQLNLGSDYFRAGIRA